MSGIAASPNASPEAGRMDLRGPLLFAALCIGLAPSIIFIARNLYFREYLGDYKVFWGIGAARLDWVYGHYGFAYPPTALLLVRPFALLPFWPSLIAWSVAGATAIILACRPMIAPRALAIGFCTNGMFSVLAGGQTSLFVGALIIAGTSARDRRLKGISLAAAAVIKPQSVLAAPVALIAERNWRSIAWAVAAGVSLLLLSVAMFGIDTWVRWATNLHKFPTYLTSRGIDLDDVGAYGLVRALGLPGWTFAIAIPPALVCSWLVFSNGARPVDRYAAFVCSTVLMSPYTLGYDLAGLCLACTALLLDRERSTFIWVAAALVLSSKFANLGIIMLAAVLAVEALQRSRRELQLRAPDQQF